MTRFAASLDLWKESYCFNKESWSYLFASLGCVLAAVESGELS